MYKNYKILATVCARGGSKGVKNKNIRPLLGKPVICYTLNAVKNSRLIDEYVISTDSDDIINIVRNYGFEVLFKRPDELAGDKVSRIEPIRHAVEWYENYKNTKYDFIIDLGVATPLKNSEDIDSAIKLIIDSGCSNVFSVCKASRNPYYNMVEEKAGFVKKVKNIDAKLTDRRDAPVVYSMNDGINIWKRNILLSNIPQFNLDTKVYIMPETRSIDIDEEIDFQIAETILSKTSSRLLSGKVVLVIGGLGLLGKNFSEFIVEHGAHCIIADNKVHDSNLYLSNGKLFDFVTLDITDKKSTENVIALLNSKFNKIDAVINTAYPRNKNWGELFENVSYSDFCENCNLHLGGYFMVMHCFANYFLKQGYGNIINIASIQGISAPKFDTYEGIKINNNEMTSPVEYSAIKAGIINLTKYCAKYFKGKNIRFNCISPGGIYNGQPEEFVNKYNKYCINKGMLSPSDLNGAVLFLLSDGSASLNGQNIVIDDGWSL